MTNPDPIDLAIDAKEEALAQLLTAYGLRAAALMTDHHDAIDTTNDNLMEAEFAFMDAMVNLGALMVADDAPTFGKVHVVTDEDLAALPEVIAAMDANPPPVGAGVNHRIIATT